MAMSDDPAPPRLTDSGFSVILDDAGAALDRGEISVARGLARRALASAQNGPGSDERRQALARLRLAQADMVVSKYRRAHAGAAQAVRALRAVGDVDGEVAALATLSQATSALGMTEESVAAALLAVQLSHRLEAGLTQVMAYSCLGGAHHWSGSLVEAEVAFDTALRLSRRSRPRVGVFQVLLLRLLAQAMHVVNERYLSGAMPPLRRLQRYARQCRDYARRPNRRSLSPGAFLAVNAAWPLLNGVCLSWEGDLAGADRSIEVGRQLAAAHGTPTWLDPLESWARVERAWAAGRWMHAGDAARRLTRAAQQLECAPLVSLGLLLQCQVQEKLGNPGESLRVHRELRLHEGLVRLQNSQSREQAAKWQIDARRNLERLRAAEAERQELERLSFEDALTGLPNRRCIERRLAELLSGVTDTGNSFCLAMVDVDQFKLVNDTYLHTAGDQVLCAIAAVFNATLRQQDIAARWAGDEFVLVLRHTDVEAAAQVCQRVANKVAALRWPDKPALRTGVTIGLAQARPGDTPEALHRRADQAMYGARRQTRLPA